MTLMSTEHPDSYYVRALAPESARPALHGSVETEVAIIGGGLAGLSAAVSLIEKGQRDVVVLEARRVGWGASGRNAGQVSVGFSLDPWCIEEQVGRASGQALFALTCEAVRLIRARIERYQIRCAGVETGGLKAWWTPDSDDAKRQLEFLNEVLGMRCELWPTEQLRAALRTKRYYHALYSREVFQLQPLSYVRGLAQVIEREQGRIYEETAVRAIDNQNGCWVIRTTRGELRARYVLCACGGYLAELVPEVARALVGLETQVMVTAPLGARLKDAITVPHGVFDSRLDHDYYSTLDGSRLLFGGGVSLGPQHPRRVARRLRRRLLAVYPQLEGALRIENVWSGRMDYSRHQMPLLGQTRAGIWYSAGHGGHGLGTTALLGELFARAVVEKDDSYRLLAPWGLQWTGGLAGLAVAQLTYWYYKGVDVYKEWSAPRKARALLRGSRAQHP